MAAEWRTGLTRVSIPMLGRADSLNVAASAAVLLFEARARWEDPRPGSRVGPATRAVGSPGSGRAAPEEPPARTGVSGAAP